MWSLLILILVSHGPAACEPPLPFWIGDWELSWPAGQGGAPADRPGQGSNRVRRQGCGVLETFHNRETGLRGTSFSARRGADGEIVQLWSDSSGSLLQFRGRGQDDGSVVLYGEPRRLDNGRPLQNRMRFLPRDEDGLDWVLEYSIDEGRSWTEGWRIEYRRAASP